MGGRNKDRERLTKKEKKALKNGLINKNQGNAFGKVVSSSANTSVGLDARYGEQDYAPRRTRLDTRRPSKSNASILHAILFCVLVAIIVSWALGY